MSEVMWLAAVVVFGIGMFTIFAVLLCIAFYAYQHHLEREHKSTQEECCAQEGVCIECGAESGVFIKCDEHRKAKEVI